MNVNNSTQSNETFTWTPPISLLHTRIILKSILLVWSLLGNVLVIAVVYYNQNLRTNMNYLIVNMAVSDLLVPLVAVPWAFQWDTTNDQWLVNGPLGDALCKLVPFLSDISPFVSSITLLIIAFQRFIAVVYPTRRHIFRSRKTRLITISFPWIVAMALFSPYLYMWRLRTNEWGYTRCDCSWLPAFDYSIFLSMQTAVGFVIPLTVIIILYIIIVYKLRKSLNNVMDLIVEERIRSRQRRNRRIFSMLITIIVMFTICWCPLSALYSLIVFPRLRSFLSVDLWTKNTKNKIVFAVWYMLYSLAAINPCIYFVFLRDFRQGLKSLCCRKTASLNEPIARRPRTPGEDEDGNQDPTCTPLHINTTSV